MSSSGDIFDPLVDDQDAAADHVGDLAEEGVATAASG
jgi:hypothetical protein